jgi:hypothetical protein
VANRPPDDADVDGGGVVEIGREMADAIDAENRHRRAHGKGVSPLHGIAYDPWRGEVYLHTFVDSPVDEELRKFVSSYSALDAESMARVRASLTMDDFYTLVTFARRCAVSAMRDPDQARAQDGVVALTAVDAQRLDWRDVSVAAALLSHALDDRGASFRHASGVAESNVADILRRFADEPVKELTSWGYREVETPGGAVLIDDWGEPYDPATDLIELAFEISGLLRGDVYEVTNIVAGSDLPAVWLPSGDPAATETATSSLLGCVSLNGALRPEAHRKAEDQQLTVFLAEAADQNDAGVIAAASSVQPGSSHEALGLADDRLCSVTVARSFVDGSPSFERSGSLERFRPSFARLLAQAGQR